jgi:hypothetical protein
MGRIVGQAQRVGDAHARKGQALLARQVGDGLGQPMAQRVAAALQHSGVQQPRHGMGRDGTVGHTASRRLDLHQGLQPQQAARAIAHDLNVQAARGALALQGAGHGIGPHGQSSGIAGNVDAYALRCRSRRGGSVHRSRMAALLQQRVQILRRHMGMGMAIEHHGRRRRTQSQAVHRLQRHGAIGAAAMGPAAHRLARMLQQRVGTARLAGLGAADLQHMAARRRGAEMGVVGEDAMHLGAREVQCIGDARHGGFGDMAQRVLHGVQQLDQGTGAQGPGCDGVVDGLTLMGGERGAGGCAIGNGDDGNDAPVSGWHGDPCWLSLWEAARSGPHGALSRLPFQALPGKPSNSNG